MRQQKLRRSTLFLFEKDRNAHERGKERASKPQDISTLDGIESNQCSEVQAVHPERGGETAHRRKHFSYSVHFAFHLREHEYTNDKQKGDRACPDYKSSSTLPQLMLEDGHFSLPPSS